MKSFKRTATISKRSPRILLRVPRRCTNGSEEVFHRCFIPIEQLAVEVTWVPIDYHTPKIEDCGTIFCHCKYILSFLRESSIMSVSRAMRNLFRARVRLWEISLIDSEKLIRTDPTNFREERLHAT